ncbi:uncharacterized protein GLRG_09537 [Colletotrichum graminicola M1.001]|uniref:mRNA stability protein n=1 Tax=Colletotrichum graminicola (strain M1.001 / M2 / FGSC 10212) TaxID=645133 RepID=E3QU55_COLGM|nr:uncharacterized protein GLRG_09537 [Colletotrichum graminicola M1.001]EFQ34393.1 hypothetical protein GLRG_09537 [Colletotrichum graminicola M1.001]
MGSQQTSTDSPGSPSVASNMHVVPAAAAAKEDRIRRLYGKAPARSDLLHKQMQRKYFDSGDYALQDAHKPSSMGPVQTGAEHPLRKNIPHPSSPVPTSSNIVDIAADRHRDATKGTDTSGSSMHRSTPLREVLEKDPSKID